jgi:hypothetical protein
MKVWPFMFAASRTLDYQFVALPETFDAQSHGSLRDRLEMDEADPKRIRTTSLPSPQGNALSCIYRSGPITVGNEVHVDSAGRKLLFAFGLVVEALPETLDQMSDVLDVTEHSFERRLISFLNSSENWTPIVTKSFDLPIDLPAQISGRFRRLNDPVAILSIAALLLLVLCAGLYLKNQSLEAQLIELRSTVPKSAADGDLKNNPAATPSPTPRIPEDGLETKGPLTIQK